MKLIKETLEFIKRAHKGQTDKLGEEYWKHPNAVHDILVDMFEETTHNEKEAALLHDILEDTIYTSIDFLEYPIFNKSIDIVMLVSKFNNIPHRVYVDNIILSRNVSAMKVKLADIVHNLDSKRLSKLDDTTQSRLKKKYYMSKMSLLASLDDLGVVLKFPMTKYL